jgi:hypothetical protein
MMDSADSQPLGHAAKAIQQCQQIAGYGNYQQVGKL